MSEPRATVHTLTVPRTARFARLGDPGPDVREVWYVLHGYRQLAERFIRRFHPLAAPHRLILAPEALNRFYIGDEPGRHGPEARVGGTWMTREARELEIADYVLYLDRLAHETSASLATAGCSTWRTVVLGFSQGVHTAARWASAGSTDLDHLVLWGEHLPRDLDTEAAAATWGGGSVRVHLVRGETDPDHGEAREREDVALLERLGVEVVTCGHPAGHQIEAECLARVAREVGEGQG